MKLVSRVARAGRRMRRDDQRASVAAQKTDRIHYACGANILDGWLNVDGFVDFSPTPGRRQIYSVDLTDRHPFPDGHWRYGYAEDFLEHLDQADSLIFLAECHRTFKPGGVLRLSFPSLRGVLERHYRSSDHAGAMTGKDEAYVMWEHLHFYSLEELQLVAGHIGWTVEVTEYGKSEHEPLRGVDTREGQIGLNLIVELTAT